MDPNYAATALPISKSKMSAKGSRSIQDKFRLQLWDNSDHWAFENSKPFPMRGVWKAPSSLNTQRAALASRPELGLVAFVEVLW